MFDIKWIRDNPEAFDAGLKKRGISPGGDVKFASDLIALDEARRSVITRLQEKQARRNAASKEIGKAKAAKDEAKAAALMAEVAALKDELAKGEDEQRAADKALHDALSVIPNVPLDEVPVGKDEHDNEEVRRVGRPPKLGWTNKPREHYEIGEALGLMDFETAAKLSGSRFVVLRGQLARLERALAQFMLDLHTAPEKDSLGGYTEIVPPYLVRNEVMFGTAQLPKFADDQFAAKRNVQLDDNVVDKLGPLYAELTDRRRKIGELKYSSTPALQGQIPGICGVTLRIQVPRSAHNFADAGACRRQRQRIVAHPHRRSPAHQSRARVDPGRGGAADPGDGLLAVLPRRGRRGGEGHARHDPAAPVLQGGAGVHHHARAERGRARAHDGLRRGGLEAAGPRLPHHAAQHRRHGLRLAQDLRHRGVAAGAGHLPRDLVLLQLRRLPGPAHERTLPAEGLQGPMSGAGIRYVHTLNGSGLAVGRTLIAILENYQQEDGSVAIPEALVPYMGGLKRIEKP